MIKKLFSDTVVARLRALPSFVWVLFTCASFFFARAYEFLITSEYVTSVYADAYAELGYNVTASTMLLGIIATILSAVFCTLVLEIILYFTYGFVAGRFRANINKADYKFRVRYLVILINLLVGILSIAYFFTQKIDGVAAPHIRFFTGFINYTDATNHYYEIQNAFLPFLAETMLVMLFYGDFRKRFVPKSNQAKLFATYALIFVGIDVLIFVVNLVRAFLANNVYFSVYDIASLSVEGGVFLLVGVIYFFYYRYLKKSENDFDPIIRVVEDEKTTDGNIYDDFGF